MERNILIDKLKGYACFLVLFGHVIMGIRLSKVEIPVFFHGLEKFIWSFHVSLFLFLSGAVYKITGEWKKKGRKIEFLKYKLISLGIPYIIFSAVYILINSFAGGANTQFSLLDILYIWKTPVAQYWFLYALFFLFCIWTIFSDTLKNWQITVLFALFGYVAPAFQMQFGSFEVVIYSALAFGLGTTVNIADVENISSIKKLLVILVHIVSGIILIYFGLIDRPLFKEAIMIIGIYASIVLISMLQKISPFSKFLDFMNKYSFQTYLLHTIFTAGIRILLLKLGISQWVIHILIGTACGIGFSYLVAIIASKIKFINFCFFPSKILRKK